MARIIEAEVAVPARCQLGEGPVWDPDRGLLWWVDILAGHVHAVDPATGVRTWFDAGDPVGAVGLTRSGGLVLALVDGFAVADDNGGHMTRVPGFGVDRTAIRFNDGKPDPWGNFCAGTMAWDETGRPPGSLYRLSPDGAVTELFGDVGLSNGLDWTDDRRLFYYADSNSGRVDLFDIDPDTGLLTGRRPFVTIPAADGVPDGLTLDAEGCIWLAVWGSGEVRRFTPAGQLDTVVRLPARQVTSAAFGGPDLGTLYITTAWEGLTPAERAEQPHAGDIFACVPGVTGRPPFLFEQTRLRSACDLRSLWPAGVAELGAGQSVTGHDGHGRGEGQHRGLGREVLQEQAAASDADRHAQEDERHDRGARSPRPGRATYRSTSRSASTGRRRDPVSIA